MKPLTISNTGKLHKLFAEKFRTDSSAWLANQFRGVYEKEIYVEKIGVEKLFQSLRKITKVAKAVVFEESFKDYRANASVSQVTISDHGAKQLLEYLDDRLAINTYLTSATNPFQWIITFCHEGDIHIAGDRRFLERVNTNLQ